MANTTTKSAQKQESTEAETTVVTTTKSKANAEMEQLKAQNDALAEQLKMAMAALEMATKKMNTVSDVEDTKVETTKATKYSATLDDAVPEEPAFNKMIRVVSMCYGSLTLNVDGNPKLKFAEYGEIKPVLYSTLIEIVNQNHSFATSGKFYILDKGAVYYLGLSNSYKSLFPSDVLDKVLDYNEVEIKEIVSSINVEQKETLAKNIADKIYRGETVDYNAIEIVSKACGFDIRKMAEEMKELKI